MYVDSAESQGVVGQRKKCLVQQLGRRICPESVLDCGCRIKVPVKFTVWEWQVAWWLWLRALTAEAQVRFHDRVKYLLPYGLLRL